MCFHSPKHAFQALNLGGNDAVSQRRQAVIPTTWIVVVPAVKFLDKAMVEKLLEVVIERTGAELVVIVRLARDLLHDPVAVTIFIGKRNQDMKRGGRKG